MKISLGQLDVVCGDMDGNVKNMEKMIASASEQGSSIIVFSEMCVGGYFLGDLYLDDDFCLELMRYNKQIAIFAAKYKIAVAYGNVYLEEDINTRLKIDGHHPNKDGRRRRYNAVYVFDRYGMPATRKNNNLLPPGVAIKTNLPNYRIFDDERYFFSMADHCLDFGMEQSDGYSPFLIDDKQGDGLRNIGFALCEDLWCEDYRIKSQSQNPTRYLTKNKAELIFNLSASPWTYGKNGARDRRVKFVQQDIKSFGLKPVPMYYVNCSGVQNNGKNIITFDGGTTAYNEYGDIVYTSTSPNDLATMEEVGSSSQAIAREIRPEIEEKYKAIKSAIQHTVKCKMVIGISGGIDSAVSSALLVDAIGKENVIGINMPTKYNSDTTKNAAAQIAKKLGIKYAVVPIEDMVSSNKRAMNNYFAEVNPDGLDLLPSIVDENIQAKIRGASILSNIAQIERGGFCNNGNKIEIAIGYATLYGDWGGMLAPLGDLTKTEVYDLGKYLNKEVYKQDVIPIECFEIAPSAELKDNQVDPIKIGYHCGMIKKMTNYGISSAADFMEWWLQGTLHYHLGITADVMKLHKMDEPKAFLADLEWFLGRERGQVFKRVQSVPIVLVSKTAYGYDRRESVLPPYRLTKKAEDLKATILTKDTYEPAYLP